MESFFYVSGYFLVWKEITDTAIFSTEVNVSEYSPPAFYKLFTSLINIAIDFL